MGVGRSLRGLYLRNGIYWLAFQRDGKRKFVSLETRDEVEAIRRAREVRQIVLLPECPWDTSIDAYLAEKRSTNVYTRRTERLNRGVLSEFARAGCPISSLSQADVAAHYRTLQRRVAETTAQIHLRAIRAFLAWCQKTGRCASNPAKGIVLAKVERPARLRFCTAAERDALISGAPTDDLRFILYCGFHAGMRKNEIIEARARWFDVRPGGAIHICSTASYRLHTNEEHFVPLTAEFMGFLSNYLPGDPEAFALRPEVVQGRGTYRYDFHRPYHDYMTAMGMRWVTAHVMRHTFASLLVQRGVSIYKVAKWLGDGVAVVEKHYAHLAAGDEDIERML